MNQRKRFLVNGIVQGVGFRPYIYGLACSLGLTGWVLNSAAGVEIEVEGPCEDLTQFTLRLPRELPPLALLENLEISDLPCLGESVFRILPSSQGERSTLISPDMAVCPDCLADMADPANRRYRYAFTNCTNCGPRFTIIKALPYDRPQTTMAGFPMCPACREEYENPADRRFHAQPNACPICGPRLSFYDKEGQEVTGDIWELVNESLSQGDILAVKGLGGYHLVCDAKNDEAVTKLRGRKYRWDKPFAIMVPSLEIARRFCRINREEEELLISPRRPIVLLEKDGEKLAPDLAPGNKRLGLMLPYTPLHHLLLEGWEALVMTSANISDEPIVYEDEDAFRTLGVNYDNKKQELTQHSTLNTHHWSAKQTIADGFLSHDRPIFRRCDDSVAMAVAGRKIMIRQSRGFAPEPLRISQPQALRATPFGEGGGGGSCRCSGLAGLEIFANGKEILACGGEQKNTFGLFKGGRVFLSQHIGDLENLPTYQSYQQEINYFSQMFNIKPQVVVYDLHPDYLASQYALAYPNAEKIGVQHHHAHLASVLAEHGRHEPAIGLIFDGTGYGEDGHLWGGEILLGDCCGYRRWGHLDYLPLPGGEQAIHQPWRVAAAYLALTYGGDKVAEIAPPDLLEAEWPLLWQAVEKNINAPLSCGMGRLFDGVAALCGIGRRVNYEGQAAVELEQVIDLNASGSYNWKIMEINNCRIIDWRPLIREINTDLAAGAAPGIISARFHRAVIELCRKVCLQIREEEGLNLVALSGGVWQNVYLLRETITCLEKAGFEVLTNQAVPANDGGLAYGQIAVASAKLKR